MDRKYTYWDHFVYEWYKEDHWALNMMTDPFWSTQFMQVVVALTATPFV